MPRGIPSKKPRKIFVAKELFLTTMDGTPVTVPKGATVREGHSLLLGREHLFAPLKVDYDVAEDPEPEDTLPQPPAAA